MGWSIGREEERARAIVEAVGRQLAAYAQALGVDGLVSILTALSAAAYTAAVAEALKHLRHGGQDK